MSKYSFEITCVAYVYEYNDVKVLFKGISEVKWCGACAGELLLRRGKELEHCIQDYVPRQASHPRHSDHFRNLCGALCPQHHHGVDKSRFFYASGKFRDCRWPECSHVSSKVNRYIHVVNILSNCRRPSSLFC